MLLSSLLRACITFFLWSSTQIPPMPVSADRDNNIEECGLEMYFAQEYETLGELKTHELVPDGEDRMVTEECKLEYIE